MVCLIAWIECSCIHNLICYADNTKCHDLSPASCPDMFCKKVNAHDNSCAIIPKYACGFVSDVQDLQLVVPLSTSQKPEALFYSYPKPQRYNYKPLTDARAQIDGLLSIQVWGSPHRRTQRGALPSDYIRSVQIVESGEVLKGENGAPAPQLVKPTGAKGAASSSAWKQYKYMPLCALVLCVAYAMMMQTGSLIVLAGQRTAAMCGATECRALRKILSNMRIEIAQHKRCTINPERSGAQRSRG